MCEAERLRALSALLPDISLEGNRSSRIKPQEFGLRLPSIPGIRVFLKHGALL